MLYSFDQPTTEPTVFIPEGEPSNEQLMENIQGGDEKALELLHSRYHNLLGKVIRRIIGSDADVDELLQECLLEVWKRAASYDPTKGHALGWLVTMARRRAIDRVRRRGAYGRAQDRFRLECESGVTVFHSGADEEAAQDDTAALIQRLIDSLPAAQQEAVRLAYFKGMSQRQIAAHTGIPLGTIKTRLELAMRKLKSAVLAVGELHEPMHQAA